MAKRKRPSGPKRQRAAASDFADTERIDAAHEGDLPSITAPDFGGARWKTLLSLLLIFHLLAVVLPPLAFQTFSAEGPSPLVGNLIRPFAGYGQFLHMDRGYAFFAPDPGPSHLIQAAVVQPDGEIVEQLYPNLDEQWPRLLYHRHFMLSEYLNEVYFPPGPPEELFESDRPAAEMWQQRRARYEYVRQSMIDHLRSQNEGREVAIRRIEHLLPALSEYQREPIELTDPRLYQVLVDQPIYLDDELPPGADGVTEEIPAPLSADGKLPAQTLPRSDSAAAEAGAERDGQAVEPASADSGDLKGSDQDESNRARGKIGEDAS